MRRTRPPRAVPCWYLLCSSDEIRRGAIRRFELGGQPIVLFRGRESGVVHALPAHCQHQGVDLGHGCVVGDRLRCPLHHWEYTDRCLHIADARPHFRVAERYGMIFVYTGEAPLHGVPGFSVPDEELYFRAGKAVTIDCPWYVPVANAFDMTHLETVHRRRLVRAPVVSHPHPFTFRVDYTTAVTGRGWSDRAMKMLSGNDIRVEVTSTAGVLLQVESQIRRWRSFLLVCLRPTPGGVSILPIFGVPRRAGGAHQLHARAAAALFTAFLARDVKALGGIRFPEAFVDGRDPTINACYRFLCELPELQNEEM
jgi:phenylpropionate dioxygenase-like ring-hydroxylating dioxygenase large terminal subunit